MFFYQILVLALFVLFFALTTVPYLLQGRNNEFMANLQEIILTGVVFMALTKLIGFDSAALIIAGYHVFLMKVFPLISNFISEMKDREK